MKFNKFHENPNILHVGTNEDRSYYTPASKEELAIAALEGESNRKLLLNGDWKFKYFNSFDYTLNYNQTGWEQLDYNNLDTILVPSCWQNYGYDRHMYTNQNYPFTYDPPFVPDENPCGLYTRHFTIYNENRQYRQYINFEGVDSCFYLWINGEFVGYSQVSHATSEFEITDYVRQGDNIVSVLVLKWCDGSYLEDQDKLRMSGIFRDVYILKRPKYHIDDFFVHTKINEELDNCSIEVDLLKSTNINVSGKIYSPKGKLISKVEEKNNKLSFNIEKPILWNAETPIQYTLVISTEDESIAQMVGIRKVEIKNGIVCVNNKPVKFLGVNRHDSDPFTGFTISREQAYEDFKLMKQSNINAIRTSHYPNAPWFLQMCSRYGFYVIAEADIETHGAVTQLGVYGDDRIYSELAIKPLFKEAIIDRVQKSVIRDKNNAAVLIWSLGNECGYGPNFENAGRWVKNYDSSRLLHYEGAYHHDDRLDNDFSMLDLFSRMYASIENVDDYFADKKNTKPFLQCEFLHAMGNSPGDVEENILQIYKYDRYCGGFVWEWCDHAVYGGKTQDGKKIFRYGGDFGEFPHDGNFCIDGLVYPDRRPHTGLLEYKNCLRPIRASKVKNVKDTFEFESHFDFINTGKLLDVNYRVSQDGQIIHKGILENIYIEPHQKIQVKLNYDLPRTGDITIVFSYTSKYDMEFYNEGYVLGFDEIVLNEKLNELETLSNGQVCFKEDVHCINVYSPNFRYEFNKHTGIFDSMNYKNISLINKPCEWNIWRAPTDNDRRVKNQWRRFGYDRHTVKVYSTDICSTECGRVKINAMLSIGAIYIRKFIDIDVTWEIDVEGNVVAFVKGIRDMETPYLPRFGVRMFMPKSFDECKYFGYGPYESYIDKHRTSTLGTYTEKVVDMHEPYIVPQENSSHYGCRFVRLSNDKCVFNVKVTEPFSFNVSQYTQEELTEKMHDYELETSESTVVCIDAKMSGIGSNSCGPQLFKEYRVDDKEIIFKFSLTPKLF